MQMHVAKWGNSLGIRIPRVLARTIGIREGTPVDISTQNQHIIITKRISLQSLLGEITSENIHKEVQTGDACGKESW